MTIVEVLVYRLQMLSKFVDADARTERILEVSSIAKSLYDVGHLDSECLDKVETVIDSMVFHIKST